MNEPQRFKARCKKCGGADIGGYDKLIAIAAIVGFEQNEHGEVVPVWGDESEVDWNSQEPFNEAKPYWCGGCGELLSVNDLELSPEVGL